jgi:hypothetical protein
VSEARAQAAAAATALAHHSIADPHGELRDDTLKRVNNDLQTRNALAEAQLIKQRKRVS